MGLITSETLVSILFTDGSVVNRNGRFIATCSVYGGVGSPLNHAVHLATVRSSFVAEMSGIEFGLRQALAYGKTDVLICLGITASF